jgi:GT2 family glycosyltransferase
MADRRTSVPSLRRIWRLAQGLLHGSRTIQGWVDPQFYASQVGPLPPGLSAATHYLRHGWREGRQPHPLFEATFYLQACINAGLGAPQGPALLHYCRQGMRAGVPGSTLFEPTWWAQQRCRQEHRHAPPLAAVHPLGAWALALRGHDQTEATTLLRQWQSGGLSAADLQQIGTAEQAIGPATTIPKTHRLALLNGSAVHWSSHAWLQHVPVTELRPLETALSTEPPPDPSAPTTLLLLPQELAQQHLPYNTLMHWWHQASAAQQVIVADSTLATLLQGMGVKHVQTLQPSTRTNGWLESHSLLEQAEAELGLPPPAGLRSAHPIVLGDAGACWQGSLSDQLIALPGWEHCLIQHAGQARAQAAWLQRCGHHDHALVLLNPMAAKRDSAALSALEQSALILRGTFTEESLLKELSWHQQGCTAPTGTPTPQPSHTILWQHMGPLASPPRVSVCISLHNYAHTIERALDSVRAQTLHHQTIELLVVDDASRDAGVACVQAWMERHGAAFHSCTLLQHQTNGGLAAARNTAFAAARADWCFVLDADNLLHPPALEACLALAQHTNASAAVIHPWIAREREHAHGQRQREGLHGIALWQRERFLHGNHIDAMALVRRSAWRAVGGYVHIPGGWEDFDFWCCLIAAGWHGVCLPQTLCSYVVHSQSMLATETNANLRPLCRLLQHRHPWLELNPDGSDPNGGAHRH